LDYYYDQRQRANPAPVPVPAPVPKNNSPRQTDNTNVVPNNLKRENSNSSKSNCTVS